MKLTFLVLVILIFIDATLLNMAMSADPHHDNDHEHDPAVDGTNGTDGVDGAPGTNGINYNYRITDDDLIESVMAASMAVSVIEFSHGTRKDQVGVGVGNYNGHNSLALGYAKLIETENTEFLGVAKFVYVDENDDFAVGVGATWLLGD